jgi:integrase
MESHWCPEGLTLRDVWRDYRRCRPLKPGTVADYDKRLRQCLPDWLDEPIEAISKARVEERHKELSARGGAQANVTMRVLRAIINFAIVRYDRLYAMANPVKRLSEMRSWNRIKRRKSVLYGPQLESWMKAVQSLDNSVVRDYFTLLLFTGLRKGEGARIRRKDVDLKSGVLKIFDTKNHEDHELPITDYISWLLARRLAQPGGPEDYLFPGKARGSHLRYPNRHHALVRRLTGVNFILHDLRRTFLTVADSLDIPMHIIKRLANHRDRDVTEGYIILSIERLRRPMQAVTDELLRLGGVLK